MNLPFSTALPALAAALCWGVGDFTGGLVTRRSDALRSVLFIYGVGMAALWAIVLLRGELFPPPADLAWGAFSGLCGGVGVVFLFQGFAAGRMGVVAPVAGVLGAGLPAVFNAFTEGLPRSLQLVGFGIAILGIWLLARPERLSGRPAGLRLALAAGVGFGMFFIALDQVSAGAEFWPLVAGRTVACTALAVFAVATKRSLRPDRSLAWSILLSGVLDVAGNYLFLLAVQNGRLDIAAVLGSLYPAITAILAVLLIRERLTRVQIFGVSAAILAIVLITSG